MGEENTKIKSLVVVLMELRCLKLACDAKLCHDEI